MSFGRIIKRRNIIRRMEEAEMMTDQEIEEFETWLAEQNSGGPETGPDMERGGDPEIPW